jgi:hypothetical protein
MRFVFVTDVHLGNHNRHGGPVTAGINQRCQMILDALRNAAEYALRVRARAFFVLGDLFDTSKPTPQMLRGVQEVFNLLRRAGCSPVLLVGNHDQDSLQPGDHALAALSDHAEVIEQLEVRAWAGQDGEEGLEAILVPFNPKPAQDWIAECAARVKPTLANPAFHQRILLVHAGIWDEQTPAFLRGAKDAVNVGFITDVAQDLGCSWVLAGNWHHREMWSDPGKPTILQVGALVPTGWDNPGRKGYGTVATFDTDEGTVGVAEHLGPRFVDAELPLANLAQRSAQGERLFVRARCHPDQRGEALAQVEALTRDGKIHSGEVLVDPSFAKTAARAAAAAARSGTHMGEALTRFVSEMHLDAGVSREAVASRALDLLNKQGEG